MSDVEVHAIVEIPVVRDDAMADVFPCGGSEGDQEGTDGDGSDGHGNEAEGRCCFGRVCRVLRGTFVRWFGKNLGTGNLGMEAELHL